jgi:phospholipid/cholesterol/gamma-HCH transport system ATP-binding protein
MKAKPIGSITLEDLSFAYPNSDKILDSITCTFKTGSNVCITGSSGVGKSTLMKILVGLSTPMSGKFLIDGVDILPMSFEEFLPYRLNIGFSFDLGGLLSNRTLLENMLLPLQYHERLSHAEAMARAEDLMRDFCIWQNRNLRPANVSGGQRKACCVARAIVTQPEVLILDQPTTGLDKMASGALMNFIEKGRKDGWLKHLFVTSADASFTDRLQCETYVVFDKKFFSYEEFEKKVVFA